METKVNNFQNNAKNSSIILTQKSSETETNGSVTIFRNSEFGNIRTIVDPNGDVWFVAVDVARSLGYATPKNPVMKRIPFFCNYLIFREARFGLPWKSMS